MRQLRTFLLLILFLHSKIGVALNVHYCGGHIAVISWAFAVENCGMEQEPSSSDAPRFSGKHCCDDDLVVEQNSNDQNKQEVEQPFSTVAHTETLWLKKSTLAVNGLVLTNKPPPPKLKAYLVNCAYIFYA